MPELPEVESVRRSLLPHLAGAAVLSVAIRRRDIITGAATGAALLAGDSVERLERRGKQLAIIGVSGRTLVVHLGMSGQLFFRTEAPAPELSHVHVLWKLARGQLVFRDPRRFGGVHTLRDAAALGEHWSKLGPDALSIDEGELRERLASTRRAIKAALLDQSVLAGVGNIYADEALFAAGIAPRRRSDRLTAAEVTQLAPAIRSILTASIAAGGSTLRDYRDGDGRPGSYRQRHAVYGRGGQPCVRCTHLLRSCVIAQRATVWCPTCQAATSRR